MNDHSETRMTDHPEQAPLFKPGEAIPPGEARTIELPKELIPFVEEFELLTPFRKWLRRMTCRHRGPVCSMAYSSEEDRDVPEFITNLCIRCRKQWTEKPKVITFTMKKVKA